MKEYLPVELHKYFDELKKPITIADYFFEMVNNISSRSKNRDRNTVACHVALGLLCELQCCSDLSILHDKHRSSTFSYYDLIVQDIKIEVKYVSNLLIMSDEEYIIVDRDANINPDTGIKKTTNRSKIFASDFDIMLLYTKKENSIQLTGILSIDIYKLRTMYSMRAGKKNQIVIPNQYIDWGNWSMQAARYGIDCRRGIDNISVLNKKYMLNNQNND